MGNNIFGLEFRGGKPADPLTAIGQSPKASDEEKLQQAREILAKELEGTGIKDNFELSLKKGLFEIGGGCKILQTYLTIRSKTDFPEEHYPKIEAAFTEIKAKTQLTCLYQLILSKTGRTFSLREMNIR